MNRFYSRKEGTIEASTRRFVKVVPPTVHAGIGNALREAFAMNGEKQTLSIFDDLLAKLD